MGEGLLLAVEVPATVFTVFIYIYICLLSYYSLYAIVVQEYSVDNIVAQNSHFMEILLHVSVTNEILKILSNVCR